MPRKLKESVVVITGASSGIGRATAKKFAKSGAKVVLTARREAPIRELANEIERNGGRAIAIAGDVRDEEAVKHVAHEAVSTFGRLDVWVNNAGVSLFSRFEEAPPDVYRNVFETNFFGYVHGIRAALPHFRERGGGVVINNSSVLGQIGAPFLSAYASSKFAIRGLGESLWHELRDDGIYVCTVSPASIDTPIFQHAANYSGRATKPLEPIYDAGQVATAIVNLAKRPRREVIVGRAGSALSGLRRFTPGGTSRAFANQVESDHFQDRPETPNPGNVLEPDPHYTDVSGGWKSGNGGGGRRRLAIAGVAALPAIIAWRRLRDSKASLPFTNGNRASGVVNRFRSLRKSRTGPAKMRPWHRLRA